MHDVYANITLLMVEVRLYLLHSSLVKENLPFVLSFVDGKRKEKAERLVNEKDKLLSLGAGYLLKKYLPKGEIKLTDSGKPYLQNGPYFNLSHSSEYVVLAIHNSRDVGVDIEKINEDKINAIKYVLSEKERNIKELNTLFQVWSNKESLIKCLSTGLKDIKSVDGLPLEGKRIVNENPYFTKSMIYDGYSLSVTLKGEEPFIIKITSVQNLTD